MVARHTWTMTDDFKDQRNGNDNQTRIMKSFEADGLDDVKDEFLKYLWHCGYTYVEDVQVVTR